MRSNSRRKSQCKSLLGFWLLWFLVAPMCQSVLAQSDVCFPGIGSVTGLPTVDGVVEDDFKWSGAGQRNLNASSGSIRTAYFLTGRGGSDVYLAFTVDVPVAHQDDTIVLVLSTATSATDWRIHIKPWDSATVTGTNLVPHKVTYWRNSATWNDPGAAQNDAGAGFWLKDNTRYSYDGTRWSVEMRIPRQSNIANASQDDAVYFPSSGSWKFYANVLSPFDSVTKQFTQAPWPEGAEIVPPAVGLVALSRLTPPSTSWAAASLDTSICQGVSLAWNQIGAKVPPSPTESSILRKRYGSPTETFPANCAALNNTVAAGPKNVFFARPGNSGADAAGVSATFWIANWGIPSPADFTKITGPVLGPTHVTNPTLTQTVLSGGGQEFNLEWSLTDRESCTRAKANGGHFCMLAELDSTAAGVRFVNRSVVRNMDFVPASTFSRPAVISARKVPMPAGQNAHQMLLTVDTERQLYTQDGPFLYAQKPRGGFPADLRRIPAEAFAKRVQEGLVWVARGYFPTGGAIIINEDRKIAYEYARFAGGFGYVVGHEKAGEAWTQDIKAPELKSITEMQRSKGGETRQLFALNVPKDGQVVLDTRIAAGEGTGTETGTGTGDGGKPGGNCKSAKLASAPAALAAFVGVGVVLRRRRRK